MSRSTIGELSALGADESNQLKIVEFFKGVSLSQNFPPAPSCDLLDIAVVEQLAKNATKDGQVDLIALHELLRLELGPQVDQSGKLSHPKLESEVESVLRWLHQVWVPKQIKYSNISDTFFGLTKSGSAREVTGGGDYKTGKMCGYKTNRSQLERE